MGYNTTVVVMNDALNEIEEDKEFSKKLVAAIRHASLGDRAERFMLEVSSGGSCNVATVIESHHSDSTVLVAIGGNCGSVINESYGWHHGDDASNLRLIKDTARSLGYDLWKRR